VCKIHSFELGKRFTDFRHTGSADLKRRPACGDSPGNGSFVTAGGAHVPSTSIAYRVGSSPATTDAPPLRQPGGAAGAGVAELAPFTAWGPPPAGLDWSDVASIPELASGRHRVVALVLCLVLLGVSLLVALVLSSGAGSSGGQVSGTVFGMLNG
jgi:hypothetical protein